MGSNPTLSATAALQPSEPGNLEMTSIVSPSITAIVCTCDRPVLLEQCLRALSRQTYPRFDILVVDNASAQPVQDICLRWGARWVLAPLRGVARARNVGAKLAQGEIIAYIDDDAVAEVGWLEALVEDFQDREVAAVSGGIRYMKAQGDSRTMSGDEATHSWVRARRKFDQNTSDWFALACFGGIGDGGNMAFRRELIVSLQSFDERLGRGRVLDGGEEHVLFASLIARGYRIAHNPAAIWRHPSPPTAELQRARRFCDLRSSIAYLIFLWNEFPPYRGDILRFLQRALVKRVTATHVQRTGTARLSRARAAKAVLDGCFVYAKARREWAAARARSEEEAIGPPPNLIKPASDTSHYAVE